MNNERIVLQQCLEVLAMSATGLGVWLMLLQATRSLMELIVEMANKAAAIDVPCPEDDA